MLASLREVAADLREHAGLPADYRIESHDEGLQASPKRDRTEARLKLGLLHSRGFHVAADEGLTRFAPARDQAEGARREQGQLEERLMLRALG